MPRAKPSTGTALGALHAQRLHATVKADPDDDAALQPRQTIVSATKAPPARTQAAASIFALGDAAKPPPVPADDWDPDAVPIEKDVPIPKPREGALIRSRYRQLLARMEPGTRVVLPAKRAKSLVASAKLAKIPVTFRRLDDDMVGVWRKAAA